MNTTMIADEKHLFVKDFEAVGGKDTPNWLRQLRQNALESFLSLPFPTTRDEDWRFTSVAPILKAGFELPQNFVSPSLGEIERFLFNDKSPRLVFINGNFSSELSQIQEGKSFRVSSLANLSDMNKAKEHLARYAHFEKNIFTALNTAFLHDGAIVMVPERSIMEEPIHILFISTSVRDEIYHPRALIIIKKGSAANIIESHVSLSETSNFSNCVTEIILEEGSILEHYKIQNDNEQSFHIATTQVSQHRDSSYTSFAVSLGAELTRNELNILLDGTGANCSLNGLYLTDGIQHVDNQTMIDHARPYGTSDELYKGILNGRSRAVFNGKILVRKDAQRTDARQTNKNLLLSDGARVNTKPQLEILADDVKCSHGATIGHLEDDALFYLKSRGMSDQNARSLLMFGFINDVLIRMKTDVIRQKLTEMVMSKLQRFGSL